MPGFQDLFDRGLVANEFAQEADGRLGAHSRILILTDTLDVVPMPRPSTGAEIFGSYFGPIGGFGIGTAINVVRQFSSGLAEFDVTVAGRLGDGSPYPGFDITGFQFSDATLAGFDQVWLFGVRPRGMEDSLDPALDAGIEDAQNRPLSDAELEALARWMDAGGGVFATGDHHLLGASLAHKVPRVSAMRRWTTADGVPTFHLTTRHHTTRPRTDAQEAGQEEIPTSVEFDDVAQKIEWVSFDRSSAFARPHPLLCHPTLGPIDVLPDHPHEGACFDFADPAWQNEKRDQSFSFGGYTGAQFPAMGATRPLPVVVAWGHTLAGPPLLFEKGDQPARRFPQIAAYDGQAVGVGRVVVDSTWHHWFDANIVGLELSWTEANQKIRRYWVNVGIFLASRAWRAANAASVLKIAQFGYFGQEEAVLGLPAAELGRVAAAHLGLSIGPCGVTQFIDDQIMAAEPSMWRVIEPGQSHGLDDAVIRFRQHLRHTVLGEIVRALYADDDELSEQRMTTGKAHTSKVLRGWQEAVVAATRSGVHAALRDPAGRAYAEQIAAETPGGQRAD